jgi:hypothetical protein
MYLLKSQFNQNLIIINHKSNSNFKCHIIFRITREKLLTLLKCKKSQPGQKHRLNQVQQIIQTQTQNIMYCIKRKIIK